MKIGIIRDQIANELQCLLNYKIWTGHEILAVLTEVGFEVSAHLMTKR